MSNINYTIDSETVNQWRYRGKYFGYPDCCIEEFCQLLHYPLNREISKLTKKHGFIPCAECRQKIENGEATLESLITNRIHHEPFPICTNFNSIPVPENEAYK